MKNYLHRASELCLMVIVGATIVNSFVVSPRYPASTRSSITEGRASFKNRGSAVLFSSTTTRPLYDGTNYTFPDTQTPAGVAELLEVSFVHACMQLASGYVDVLKMFIACSVGAYEAGFSIASLLEELEQNKDMPNTANRPLMDEEIMLRRDWLCVIYLTLAAMEHKSSRASPLAVDAAKKSIPEDIQKRYGELVARVGEAYKSSKTLSVEDLTSSGGGNKDLSPLEQAVLLQSLKVATLTPVVVEEAKEAGGPTGKKEVKPPTPPIEGAF